MKKIVLSLLLCAASAASAFAGEEDRDKSLGFGTGASFFKSGFAYETDAGNLDGEIKGFTYDFANVEVRLANKNNNFSFLAGFSAGLLFPTLNLDGECVSDKLDDPFGLRFGLELGFGYRFACTEKLSVTPSLVLGTQFLRTGERYSSNSDKGVSVATGELNLGLDLLVDYCLSEKWSVFFATTAGVNMFGYCKYEDYTEYTHNFIVDYRECDTDFGGLYVSPRIGLSFHY